MTDKFAPPIDLWDAKKCARVLGLRSVGQFKYRVECGRLPAPHCHERGKVWWSADEIRAAARQRGKE